MVRTFEHWLAALLLLSACGAKEPARTPEAPAEASPAEEPAAEPVEEPAEPEAEQSSAEPVASPSTVTARTLCESVCERVAAKCSATVAENCRVNCDQYDKTPAACEPYAREALVCAEGAKDLPCANVAPESCARHFRRVAECQRAPDTFQVKPGETKQELPAGWERFDGDGFSAPLPKGVQKTRSGQETVWSVSEGGLRYSVRKLPAPAEKLTPKSQVRLATEWLKPCNLKMKLHGHVERGERTSLHYDVGCKDGSERHGMMHITKSALFIVGIEGPAGQRGDLDAFIYGFSLD